MTDRSSEPTSSVTSAVPGRPAERTGPEATEAETTEAETTTAPERGHEATDETSDEATDVGSGAGPAPASPVTPRIRRSRPTPELPPEARETDESSLSEFFDTLDARFSRATSRLAASLSEIIDGDRRVAEHAEHADADVPAVGSAAPQPRPPQDAADPEDAADSQEGADAGEPTDPHEAPLPPPPPSRPVSDRTRRTVPTAPAAPTGSGTAGSEAAEDLPSTDDERPGRLSLPRPPSGQDDRPLPWEGTGDQAHSRSAGAERRRALILEKASAIEAATSREEPAEEEQRADDEEDLYTYIPPYNLPSRAPDPAPQRHDLLRRLFVTLGAGAAALSALWMLGLPDWAPGPRIIAVGGLDGFVDGWYSGRRSLLTPDVVHYWLWPLIAVGLVLHALHQWAPSQRSTPRQRRSGWRVGLASWLMLGWTAAVHGDHLWLAVLASLAAALALLDAVRQVTFLTARSISERRLTDVPVGLFAGWALVGAMSSVSIGLTAWGVHVPGLPSELWAMIGLMTTVWTGAYYAMTERGRMSVALGMGWGLIGLVLPRLISDAPSAWVAVGAAFGAFIVVLATESRRHRINHAERRAAMGRPVDDII